jgi:hypothetical protein
VVTPVSKDREREQSEHLKYEVRGQVLPSDRSSVSNQALLVVQEGHVKGRDDLQEEHQIQVNLKPHHGEVRLCCHESSYIGDVEHH